MEYKVRAKMPVSQRAKQFMAFAAVKGLEDALAEQERKATRVKRVELNEDAVENLNHTLQRLEKEMRVSVTYYASGHYQKMEGVVQKIDVVRQVLKVDGIAIPFENLFALKIRE